MSVMTPLTEGLIMRLILFWSKRLVVSTDISAATSGKQCLWTAFIYLGAWDGCRGHLCFGCVTKRSQPCFLASSFFVFPTFVCAHVSHVTQGC